VHFTLHQYEELRVVMSWVMILPPLKLPMTHLVKLQPLYVPQHVQLQAKVLQKMYQKMYSMMSLILHMV
jgi:hypothetical protein